MAVRRTIAVLAMLAADPALARKPAPDDEIMLDRTDPVITATIAGVPATLAVLPDAGVDLSPGYAAHVPLDWRQAQRLDIGRIAVARREADADAVIAGHQYAIRPTTSAVPCCRGHDGSIGALDLPFATVRLGRADALPEQRFQAETGGREGLSVSVRIGRETIHIVLAPDNPETVATAAAAAILARIYGGHLDPAVHDAPVLFGIARPVRMMRFDRPVPVLGFTLAHVAVRVADFAGTRGVLRDVEAQAAPVAAGDPAPDPDAIVVAHRPPPPQYRWAGLTLGRDLLDRCPMIAVYPRSREIGLACPLH